MTGLQFRVLDARPELHGAVPTLVFRIGIQSAVPVHAILLNCQLQIEPRRRPHLASEQERMLDLFGEAPRWKDTLHPLIWTRTSLTVPSFAESVEVDFPLACTYDFEVATAKYLDALEGGHVPLLFLFSGSVFAKTTNGFQVEQVPWDKEASYRMPLEIWRGLMEAYFPGCAWIRVRRESLDALQRFRARQGLLSWDDTIQALVAAKGAAAQ